MVCAFGTGTCDSPSRSLPPRPRRPRPATQVLGRRCIGAQRDSQGERWSRNVLGQDAHREAQRPARHERRDHAGDSLPAACDLQSIPPMARRSLPVLGTWPVVRQLATGDVTGLGDSARSPRTEALRPRIEAADRVVRSICPYCAVGCGQLVYVKDGKISDIEGDTASPISEGCLCRRRARVRCSSSSRPRCRPRGATR
jgi:hypothetical protein